MPNCASIGSWFLESDIGPNLPLKKPIRNLLLPAASRRQVGKDEEIPVRISSIWDRIELHTGP